MVSVGIQRPLRDVARQVWAVVALTLAILVPMMACGSGVVNEMTPTARPTALIVGNVVYVDYTNSPDGAWHSIATIAAFRIDTGALLWKHANPPSPTGSERLLSDGKRLFLATPTQITALSPKDGSPLWQFATSSWASPVTFDSQYAIDTLALYGVARGQAAQENITYFALNVDTGQLWWRVTADADPGLVAGGGAVYWGNTNNDIIAVRADTGAQMWKSSMTSSPVMEIDSYYPVATPSAFINGTLYVSTAGGLIRVNAANGVIEGSDRGVSIADIPSAAPIDGAQNVYVIRNPRQTDLTSDQITTLDMTILANDGKALGSLNLTHATTPRFYTPIAYTSNILALTTPASSLIAIQVSATKSLWSRSINANADFSASSGLIIIASPGNIYIQSSSSPSQAQPTPRPNTPPTLEALDAATGAVRWTHSLN